MELEQELKNIVRGEVASDKKSLAKNSEDKSPFKITPKIVVYPKDSEDVRSLIKFISSNKASNSSLSITARAAGTDVSGGPLNESIIVNLTCHMHNLEKVGQDYAIVEPGMYYRDFQKEVSRRNLLLPSFPASWSICAIGGMIANNAGGEKTLSYGKTADYINELDIVLRDGNLYYFKPLNMRELEIKKRQDNLEGDIYRQVHKLIETNYDLIQSMKPKVSKNSAGYALWDVYDKKRGIFDLTKLFTGSQGTLGIVTKANLRLIKPRPHSKMLVIFLKDLGLLPKVVNETLKFKPETFEAFDDHIIKIVLRYLPEFIKVLKKNIFSLAIKFLPETFMVITGGVPKLVLLAEFTSDSKDDLDKTIKEAKEALKKFKIKTRITKNQEESDKYTAMRRESFKLLRDKLRGRQSVTFIDDLIVNPEYLNKFIPELEEVLNQYKNSFPYSIIGHIGNGNLHIIPLMDLSNPTTKEIIKELTIKVNRLVLKYNGSITAEHNDGLIRGPFLKEMFGPEAYSLLEQIKNIFDPQNIFNPGKKVGTSFKYALDHLKIED